MVEIEKVVRLAHKSNCSARVPVANSWDNRSEQSFPNRVGKAALIDIPSRSTVITRAWMKVIDRCVDKEFPGYRYVGGGAEQIVMAAGNRVLKLIMADRETEEQLEDQAQILQKNSDTCQSYLGSVWVPTSFDVIRGLSSGSRILVARQPFIPASVFYSSMGHVVDDPRVDKARCREFSGNISNLHAVTGLCPELLGNGNVGGLDYGDDRSLRFVDTIARREPDQMAALSIGDTWAIRNKEPLAVLAAA